GNLSPGLNTFAPIWLARESARKRYRGNCIFVIVCAWEKPTGRQPARRLRMFRPLQSLQEKANCSNCYGRLLEKLYLFWSELLLNCSDNMSTPTNAARGLWQTEGLEWPGWALTGIGILGFTFTLPMTRLALQAFDPITIAIVRGTGAGLA